MLESIPSADGSLCVDLFEDPAGGFGFEHFRAEPEDGGRWTAIGGFGSSRVATEAEARSAACDAIPWLPTQLG